MPKTDTASARGASPCGVLLVDKPSGPTAHDIVAQARRLLRTRRVGHAGTLDPFATGLLLLCVGGATRLAEYATRLDKTYRAVLRLGAATDTDDLTGSVVASSTAWQDVEQAAIERALAAQLGTHEQQPPAYSAKRVRGERSYAAARRGELLALAAVQVRIAAIALLRCDPPDVEFEVTCSSGTYVRAIARDVGETLGCYAHLSALRRTAIGPHHVAGAVRLDGLGADDVRAALRPALDAVPELPRVPVDARTALRLTLGQRIAVENPDVPGPVAVTLDDALVAIAELRGGALRPRKVMADA